MSRSAEIGTQPIRPPTHSPSVFDADAVRRAVVANFNAAALRMEPFPHIYVENIFPADFYAALLDHFPEEDEYRATTEGSTPNRLAQLHRRRINLTKDLQEVDQAVRPYWQVFRDVIDSPQFAAAVLAKFGAPIRRQYGREDVPVQFRLQLFRDSNGYAIGPHTDSVNKVFTGLFYVPKDDSQRDLGTSIFVPKQRGFTDNTGEQFPFEPFQEFARMPFLPNSFFLFMRTNNSFHGRFEVPAGQPPRNLINCAIHNARKLSPLARLAEKFLPSRRSRNGGDMMD